VAFAVNKHERPGLDPMCARKFYFILMKRNHRIIIVLGVHRSGTSALTKGLETMGISLGNTLIAPNIFNKKGYWEDSDFHGLNLAMLNSFDERFRRILSITEEEAMILCQKGYLTRALEILDKKLAKNNLLGVKDPRFSLLLPFWKKVFEHAEADVSFLISLRNPLNVAACQEQFKNQHQEKSLWIWISYLLSCLIHSEERPRAIIDYDELLKNPMHQMQRVSMTLGLPLNPSLLTSYSYQFIDASLRHFYDSKKNNQKKNFAYLFATQMYETLLAVATDRLSFEGLKTFLEQWKEQFFKIESLLVLEEKNNHRIYNLMEANQKLHNTNIEQLKTIIDLNKTIMEKFKFVAELHETIEQQKRHIAFMKQQQI